MLLIDCMALTTATTKTNWDGWRVKKKGRQQCHGMPPLLFLLSVFVGSKVYVKKKAGRKAKRGEVEEGNKKTKLGSRLASARVVINLSPGASLEEGGPGLASFGTHGRRSRLE